MYNNETLNKIYNFAQQHKYKSESFIIDAMQSVSEIKCIESTQLLEFFYLNSPKTDSLTRCYFKCIAKVAMTEKNNGS
ncbi:hypothetical protein DRK70_20880 [Salmonella enterica subsp. enterica serovar Nima]|jgi:hypothetical protein|nr:hypothetical protein [Salmonella enterica subsp. enterica serovar Nima]ECT9453778.1 hypothetical protein [Salmonella enterica subsp. enterica serovar Oskarshamn]SQM99286.1 Uncharacterised protein [Escherichia coli]SQN35056.1 Uncharacterised protein [Escherichia coli]